MKLYKMFINGKWVESLSGKTFAVINPATEEKLGSVPLADKTDVDEAVKAAYDAFPSWSSVSQTERSESVARLGVIMRKYEKELAELETTEHGSPQSNAVFMANWSAELVEHAAQISRSLMGHVIPAMTDTVTYLKKDPVGVCALITPWNAPIMMIAAKLAPALAMGNTCVVKPPSINSIIGVKFAEMVDEAGFPPGVVNFVTGPGSAIGNALASHPDVDLVGFTGSTETGKSIMSAASGSIKKLVMELGGKNPFIVFRDAELEAAVDNAVHSLFHNSGMSCAAPGRYYVHEDMYDAFTEKFVSKTEELVMGDPRNPKTDIGPLSSAEHRDRVEGYIKSGLEEGARLLTGGSRPVDAPFDKGFWVPPAVFADVTHEMKIAREEIFGPVACIIRFSSEDDALRMANDSRLGLCASVWTKDINRGIHFVNKVRAGTVWVNEHMKLCADTTWGGIKESGLGKESGIWGIEEFTTLKLVVISTPFPE
ncbi:MAG: aldehyde dehydrogenase [Spirochaetes bacterium]|nr:aldehyde dehydrogenase [Spirochaetota bacterium]